MVSKLLDSELLKVMSDITSGKYSREIAHEEMDKLMEELGVSSYKNPTSYIISTRQLQIILNVFNVLLDKIDNLEKQVPRKPICYITDEEFDKLRELDKCKKKKVKKKNVRVNKK